jgi:WD40 repeat protein
VSQTILAERGHTGPVTAVAYDPDGQSLASASASASAGADATTRVSMDTASNPAKALERICNNVSRGLMPTERTSYLPRTDTDTRVCPRILG